MMRKLSKINPKQKARLLKKNTRYLAYKPRVTDSQIKAFWVLYGKSK